MSRSTAPRKATRIGDTASERHPAAAWWLAQHRADARDELIEDARRGPITLVVGAGVSRARGIPTWTELVGVLCGRVFGRTPPRPVQSSHPFEAQFVLELIEQVLAQRGRKATALQRQVHDGIEQRRGRKPLVLAPLSQGAETANRLFVTLLREALYENVTRPPRGQPHDTAAALARVIRREVLEGRGRIRRVITFNADDLLELESARPNDEETPLWPISRSSHHPRRPPSRCVPIYHLHGFLPSAPTRYREAPDMLVFTDLQYWNTLASPNGFANRTFMNALHDTRCVFVGLSMSDVNVIRWLGLRAGEVMEDKASQHHGDQRLIDRGTRDALDRHYWIRPDSDDPQGVTSALLGLRGVRSVSIDRWGSADLPTLLEQAFRRP